MESYLLIILIFIIIVYRYFALSEVTYSNNLYNSNKKKYLVRNLSDKDEAINTLIKIENSLKLLISKLLEDKTIINSDMYKYIEKINEKIDYVEIQESPIDSKYTSYSVNKGELLVFCIRSKITYKIHDINDLLYVAIHEIAHIGCPEIGHTDLFFKINKFLINKAIEYGIYKYVDYSINSREDCGINLTVSVAN